MVVTKNLIEDRSDEYSLLSSEVFLTSEMLRYYGIFPKKTNNDSIVFYAPNHFAPELKLELEMILGTKLKFENLDEEKIFELIKLNEEKENREFKLAV